MNAATEFAAQDAQAVAFIKRYRNAMFYAINRICITEDQRRDVFQEACIRIVSAFRRGLEHEEHLLSYAITVARNAAVDHARRLKPLLVASGLAENYEHTDPHLDPERQLMRLEAHARLHACIECLTPAQRVVMRMVVKGHTLEEIALEHELTIPGVKILAHRARLRLRNMLTDLRYR